MITLWLPQLFPPNDWYCPCIVATVILLLAHTLKVCHFIKGGNLHVIIKKIITAAINPSLSHAFKFFFFVFFFVAFRSFPPQTLWNNTLASCPAGAVCFVEDNQTWITVTDYQERCKRASSVNVLWSKKKREEYIYKAIRITRSTEAQWNMRHNNLLHPRPSDVRTMTTFEL